MSEIERQQLTWSRWQFVLTPLVTPREFNTVAMTPLHLDDLVFLLHGEVQAVHTLSLLAIVNGVLRCGGRPTFGRTQTTGDWESKGSTNGT